MIPTILLTSQSLYPVHATNSESEFAKQSRLFNKYPNPQYDQSPGEYDFDSAIDVESSMPHGIQNVYDASSGRIARSKNRRKVHSSPFHQIFH